MDDIMDGSHTRRGQPCWFRLPKVLSCELISVLSPLCLVLKQFDFLIWVNNYCFAWSFVLGWYDCCKWWHNPSQPHPTNSQKPFQRQALLCGPAWFIQWGRVISEVVDVWSLNQYQILLRSPLALLFYCVFYQVEFQTASGQMIDLITTLVGEKDLSKYSLPL